MSLHKPQLIAIALFIAAAPSAHAADDTKYETTATVQRTAEGHLRCRVTITTDPGTDREAVLTSPSVVFLDGHTASVVVGEEKVVPDDPNTTVFSGVNVQILHAVDDSEIVVITRVVENDKNTWVNVKRVAITEEKPAG